MLKKTLGSTAFYIAFLLVAVFLLLEFGTRILFALQIGPRVLLYGTEWYRNAVPDEQGQRRQIAESDPEFQREQARHLQAEARPDSVEKHSKDLGAYSKFFPHETKSTRDVDTGERIPVKINAAGFRGEEFEQQKAPGVVRVLTLGASSTFGFYDRDDETYPFYLQRALNGRCISGPRFEVINFGIPHADSDRIAALYLAEGLALAPDIVTFYEGRNDSGISTPAYDNLFEKLYSVAVHRSILAAFLDQVIVGDRVSVTAAAEKFEPLVKERSRRFLGNLSKIRDASRAQGVLLIVANQQASAVAAHPRDRGERMKIRGVTYADETAAIKKKVEGGELVASFEYSMLIHERLMKDLENWANNEGLPFVDAIAALDQERQELLSWVHLSPLANRLLADAFATSILPRFCPTAHIPRTDARRPL